MRSVIDIFLWHRLVISQLVFYFTLQNIYQIAFDIFLDMEKLKSQYEKILLSHCF